MNAKRILIVVGIFVALGSLIIGLMPIPGYSDYRCGPAIAPLGIMMCSVPSPAGYYLGILAGIALIIVGAVIQPTNKK